MTNTPATSIRLFVDEHNEPGARNMAIDECLLESALQRGICSVRIYGWDTATVSLGYFQASDEPRAPEFANLPTVRRLSGGGAILHHHEVTYSFALCPDHPLTERPSDLYQLAHRAILLELSKSKVVAAMRGVDHKNGPEPFLCFSRGDRNDIVIGAHKVVGSAQRRRRGAILQHGSLLLKSSPFAAELPGILDLEPSATLPTTLRRNLGLAIAEQLGEVIPTPAFTTEELARVHELETGTYSHLNWGRANLSSNSLA